jgi:hypothetical protein
MDPRAVMVDQQYKAAAQTFPLVSCSTSVRTAGVMCFHTGQLQHQQYKAAVDFTLSQAAADFELLSCREYSTDASDLLLLQLPSILQSWQTQVAR